MSAEELLSLFDEAGFVFRGKVVRHGRSDAEPASEAAGETVIVEVQEILRSTDVLRGLVGTEVIVVSKNAAAVADGDVGVFFTNCVSLGDQVLAREVGYRKASHESVREITESVRIVAQRPLAERVARADLICTGRVVSVKPLERPSTPRSEHDPDWSIARVNVGSVLKGPRSGKTIEVLFASSEDMVWYKSPKLHEGDSGVFILRTRDEDETPRELAPTVYQATDPLAFLPDERLPDVQRVIEQDTEKR
jgi:hypothetical protein